MTLLSQYHSDIFDDCKNQLIESTVIQNKHLKLVFTPENQNNVLFHHHYGQKSLKIHLKMRSMVVVRHES